MFNFCTLKMKNSISKESMEIFLMCTVQKCQTDGLKPKFWMYYGHFLCDLPFLPPCMTGVHDIYNKLLIFKFWIEIYMDTDENGCMVTEGYHLKKTACSKTLSKLERPPTRLLHLVIVDSRRRWFSVDLPLI